MKAYTKRELASIIKSIITEKYTNPEFLYEQLKTNINGKIKANNKQVLTTDEYRVKGLIIAKSIIEELNRIRIEILENKISAEVKTEASAGIELANYKEYFFKVAKESVRELINLKYRFLKAQVKKQNKKR